MPFTKHIIDIKPILPLDEEIDEEFELDEIDMVHSLFYPDEENQAWREY
jgi:hypothetical protein